MAKGSPPKGSGDPAGPTAVLDQPELSPETAAIQEASQPAPVVYPIGGLDRLLTGKPLPTFDLEIPERPNEDGSPGKFHFQALRASEMDEVNELEAQYKRAMSEGLPAADRPDDGGPGFHWDALVVAFALRDPTTHRPLAPMGPTPSGVMGYLWSAFAERIINELLPGTIRGLRFQILNRSGFGRQTKEDAKKG